MYKNRLLSLDKDLNAFRRGPNKVKTNGLYSASHDTEEKVSETVVDDDVFVTDILEYFFNKRLTEGQLTDELREIAAKCLWEATKASRSMDLIPRPPKSVPTPGWLVSEAVQIAYRRLRNKGIYQAVKNTVALKWRSAFEIARINSEAGVSQSTIDTGKIAEAQSLAFGDSPFSETKYATGEHVLSGLVNESPVTPTYQISVNGVKFTYGEIIAMGDFYETYDHMARASAMELGKLKALIDRSKVYFEGKVTTGNPVGTDPTDKQWQGATADRYLKLAEDNFSHFAPSNSAYISFSSSKPNHKKEWELYHAKAIDIMRKGNNSSVIEKALAVNAFGDHFLTDAFAAGHLFNKDDLSQYFKSLVLTGGKVNANGKKMFENIAARAFHGKLKDAFSGYETVDLKGIVFRPNIHTADRFKSLLIGIMEQEPDVIGKSMVAKLIHDALNKYPGGVPVTNNVGDKWDLTGDGTLNKANLEIMKKAVKQSISNLISSVNDKSPVAVFYKKVWDITPRPTAPSVTLIKNIIRDYTNPLGTQIVKGADELLQDNYETLLKELDNRKILRKDRPLLEEIFQ